MRFVFNFFGSLGVLSLCCFRAKDGRGESPRMGVELVATVACSVCDGDAAAKHKVN
jgi:hypothetical protein